MSKESRSRAFSSFVLFDRTSKLFVPLLQFDLTEFAPLPFAAGATSALHRPSFKRKGPHDAPSQLSAVSSAQPRALSSSTDDHHEEMLQHEQGGSHSPEVETYSPYGLPLRTLMIRMRHRERAALLNVEPRRLTIRSCVVAGGEGGDAASSAGVDTRGDCSQLCGGVLLRTKFSDVFRSLTSIPFLPETIFANLAAAYGVCWDRAVAEARVHRSWAFFLYPTANFCVLPGVTK